MKKPKFGRILSLLLAGIMVFMMLPGMVTAAESDPAETVMESDVLPESEMGAEEGLAPSDEATAAAAAQPEEALDEPASEGVFRNMEADTEHGTAAANNGEFDKERIAKIEIVQIKSDWWPNEYYRPVSGSKAMSLKLTDLFGNEKLVTARDTVLEDGKNVPALKFYKIGFYIPENMKEHLRYEDFTVGGETERRIIFPPYEIDHLQIGIQWEVDPSVRAESDPNGNWFDRTGDKGFHVAPPPGTCRIKIYKSDDPQKNDVTMINEDDRFNVVVTIDPQMSYVSDRLFVEIPGIEGQVELKKTTIDRVPAYANVDAVGSLSFVPLSPSKTTMENTKQRKSGVNYMITAFNAKHVLDITPYVVEGKDGTDKPQEYVTVTFVSDADKGELSGTSTYYVKLSANKTLGDIAKPAVTAKTGWKHTGWDRENSERITEDMTVRAVYEALPDVVEGKDRAGKPEGYATVTFASDGDKGELSGTSTYHVNPEANKTLGDIAKPAVTAKTGWKHTGWDRENSERITEDMTVRAVYEALPDVVEGKDRAGKPEGYVTVTFVSDADKGEVSGTSTYHVNPEANKTLGDIAKPAVAVKTGWKHTGWDRENSERITEDMTVRATYEADNGDRHAEPDPINHPDPNPDGPSVPGPDTPANPGGSSDSGTPANPGGSSAPVIPVKPGTPSKPSTTAKPNTPAAPGNTGGADSAAGPNRPSEAAGTPDSNHLNVSRTTNPSSARSPVPQTGDNSHSTVWLAVLFFSVGAAALLVTVRLYLSKKR